MKPLRIVLFFLPAAVIFGLLLLLLRIAFTSPAFTIEWKLGLLLGSAALCLLLAVTGLGFSLRWRRKVSFDFPSLWVLVPAFIAPMLVLLWPAWVDLWLRLPRRLFWPSLLGIEGLVAGQPWFYLWSVTLLGGYAVFRARSRKRKSFLADLRAGLMGAPWLIVLGLLAGLGFWLVSMFTFSLLAGALPRSSPPLLPFLRVVHTLVALLAAPWVVETFFRGELRSRWEARLGGWGASLASAALFATLQFRILLWLPIFLLGIGLAELCRRSGRLLPAVLAHTLYNLLALSLGWFLVL